MGPTLEKMLEARLLVKKMDGEARDKITRQFEAAIEDIKKTAVETLNI
jgi:truncated hemoglobin YjbI